MSRRQTSSRGLSRREALKYGLYAGLAAGVSPNIWLSGCEKRHRRKRPSIILLTVETLRADHLNCYGYPLKTSDNIDQFAQSALLFENCFSHAPVTSSSCASILSGFLPHETKVLDNDPLPEGVEILPEILQRQGYKTAAVVSNYVLRRSGGWSRGFMIYDDTMNESEQVRILPERVAEHTTDRAIELLRQFNDVPLFMWIHYQDPHGPYTPPDRFAELFRDQVQKPHNLRQNKSVSGYGGIPSYQRLGNNRDFYYYVSQYDGEIRYFDEHFKRLINEFKRLGLYDDALIIFSADHGEGMGEHNYYFAHGENLYNSLTHVPLIIKYGSELAGRRTDSVQHLDIVPTILEFIGAKTDSRFRGRDLREQQKTKSEIFAEMKTKAVIKFSLVYDKFKLIYDYLDKNHELFDLRSDPHEQHNFFYNIKYRQRAVDLVLRVKRIVQEDFLGLNIVIKHQKLTDEVREKLNSLGYIQ